MVPIVFAVGSDPISAGLVDGFAKPRGRLTGVHYLSTDLTAKRLEILKEILPKLHKAVTFYDPTNRVAAEAAKAAQEAGLQLKIEIVERHIASVEDLRLGLKALKAQDADAYFFTPDAMVASQSQFIVDTAAGKKLPTMFHDPSLVAQGALVSYGVSYHEVGRLSAKYVQQVLTGTRPENLPVESFSRLALVVNLKTARELGITIPQAVLLCADEVLVMDRRAFIGAFAGGLVIARSVAEAQPTAKVYRIGFLSLLPAETGAAPFRALSEGLRDLGYMEGRNIIFERRYADGRLERLPDLAAELVRLRVDVIVATTNPSIAAAKRATATIPIVMTNATDPVGAGFIANLARPGGNITGVTVDASPEIFGKNLGLLTDVVPRLSRVGVFRQAESGTGFAELEAAARKLNVALEVVGIRSPNDIDGAFAALTGKRIGAVIFVGGALIYMRRQQVADLALKYRLPAIHLLKEYAQAGLLMTNGPNLLDIFQRAASYIAKILGGAKPADLPVEQPTKFELVINLKTAKALGLTIPQSVLLRADEVIQ